MPCIPAPGPGAQHRASRVYAAGPAPVAQRPTTSPAVGLRVDPPLQPRRTGTARRAGPGAGRDSARPGPRGAYGPVAAVARGTRTRPRKQMAPRRRAGGRHHGDDERRRRLGNIGNIDSRKLAPATRPRQQSVRRRLPGGLTHSQAARRAAHPPGLPVAWPPAFSQVGCIAPRGPGTPAGGVDRTRIGSGRCATSMRIAGASRAGPALPALRARPGLCLNRLRPGSGHRLWNPRCG